MIDLLENFKHYKDLSIPEWELIKKHYDGFFSNRKYPRFFQSYLYLKAERRYFYYGWINDCFILLKKYKQFKNMIVYLCLPPIHKNGNLQEELKVINELSKIGIKTKLSEEDLHLYNLKGKKDRDNIEHIYNANDFDITKEGFKKFRYYLNKFEYYKNNKLINLNKCNKLSKNEIEQINVLTKNWNIYKKMFADMCQNYFNDNNDNTFVHINNDKGNIITSSMIEKINDNKLLITTNYSDYNYQINDFQSNKVLHYIIMQMFPNALINSGSAGWDKGLYHHKKQLKPCKEMQIFDGNISNKITEEQYQNICKVVKC